RGNLSFRPELKNVGDNLAFSHTPYVYKWGYWLWFILPVLILAGVATYYRAYLKANADILAVRSRKASKMARMRLRKAERCMRRKETDKFYDEMLAAIWGYLGDKLKMPLSELNRQNVSETLSGRSIPTDRIEALISLIDDCEFAKYAPAAAKADMNAVYERGVEVINGLEGAFKQQKSDKK
ncbi:MAG: hypothetical protein K2G69_03020, partial [Muribaculaceae bacterium]|nr:hypothetical protein [Muribaculaceae bacterium]